jgi:uncharacterized membrane protein
MFFFYVYSFAGWCIESTYVSIQSRKLTNRGFMRGPFLPLYGSGATMMLVVSMPFQDNIVLTYLAGCVGATVLEYVTGVVMEALFHMRYWDYSDMKFNFQGHVCLGTSLAWGGLTILMTEFVHLPVEAFMLAIPQRPLIIGTQVVTVFIFVDFALSFKAAIDLRDVLKKMEHAKEEMVRIQKRLDALISTTGQGMAESMGNMRDDMALRMEDLKSSIEVKLEALKNVVLAKPTEYLESVKEELIDLKTKYAVNLADRNRLGKIRDFFQRDLIRSNPTLRSNKYREALEELKQKTMGKKKEEDEE